MTESLLITTIIIVALMILLAGSTFSDTSNRRQRRWEDHIASEKPFQMGGEPKEMDKNNSSFPKKTQ